MTDRIDVASSLAAEASEERDVVDARVALSASAREARGVVVMEGVEDGCVGANMMCEIL